MANWELKRRATSTVTRTIGEAPLRRLVRKVSLSGLELVRRSDEKEWVPLHTLALFREEAKGAAKTNDLAALAQSRKSAMGRFIAIMLGGGVVSVASAVLATAGARSPSIGAGALAMGLVMAGWVAGMALAIKHGGRSSGRTRVAETQPALSQPLDEALRSLETALAKTPDAVRRAVNLSELEAGVAAMHRKRDLLRSLHSPGDERLQLLSELATAKECMTKATDAASADAFADEIRSIEGLLASLDRAATAAAESEARERAMVNELEALRHAVVQAAIAGTPENEMIERLASLRRQIEEETAIEKDLSAGDTHARTRALDPQKA